MRKFSRIRFARWAGAALVILAGYSAYRYWFLREVKPDLSIRLAQDPRFLGEDVQNATGSGQLRSQQAVFGQPSPFIIKLTNPTAFPAQFDISLANLPSGWRAKLWPGAAGGSAVTPISLATRWHAPALPSHTSLIFKLELTPGNSAQSDATVAVKAEQRGSVVDVVLAKSELPQFVRDFQASKNGGQDSKNLQSGDVINVAEHSTLLFRVSKGKPELPWPMDDDIKPVWNASAEDGHVNYGDEMADQFTRVRPNNPDGTPAYDTVRVECGNNKFVKVRVWPSLGLDLWTNSSKIRAGTGSTKVTALVTSFLGTPQPNIKIRFTTSNGHINGRGKNDDFALTGPEGTATVIISGAKVGRTTIAARVEGFPPEFTPRVPKAKLNVY